MRIPVIGANWKMNKTISEAESFAAEFPINPDLYRRVEVIIFPPFTALSVVGNALRGTGIKMGGQNMHNLEKGAFTGEISPQMLKDTGCTHVLLGHSERRHIFGETNKFVNAKIKSAFQHGLIPVLCIGETLEERKAGRTKEVCREQLLKSLDGVENRLLKDLIIAYEPVWAIGTGINATPEDAGETASFLRKILQETYGQPVQEAVRIQYGGSVKPENASEYFALDDIDGALVGGASLEIESFFKIVESASV